VESGATVTSVVEEAGAGGCAALKRMRLKQAAHARVVGALQERLVEVEKERAEERAARHSELWASVNAEVAAAVKEALAKVASARAALSPCLLAPLWRSSAFQFFSAEGENLHSRTLTSAARTFVTTEIINKHTDIILLGRQVHFNVFA